VDSTIGQASFLARTSEYLTQNQFVLIMLILVLIAVVSVGAWTFLPSSMRTRILVQLKLRPSKDAVQTTPIAKEKKFNKSTKN
jgi:hypothetical protein